MAAAFFLFGWWVGRGQPGVGGLAGATGRVLVGWRQIGEHMHTFAAGRVPRATLTRLSEHVGKHREHLSRRLAPLAPRRLAVPAQRLLVRVLPTTFHARQLLHQIQAADDAETISTALQTYATTALGLPRHSALTGVAEGMIAARPELDGSTLLRLFRQIDAALYGEDSVDLKGWKQRFRELARPLLHRPRRPPTADTQSLPALNPGSTKSNTES
jgi:hypothetical protein